MRLVLGLFILVLLLGTVLALLVYVPMLPLLVPVWVVGSFEGLRLSVMIPVVYVILIGGLLGRGIYLRGEWPTRKGIGVIFAGLVVLLIGATIFVGVWEILIEQHEHAQQADVFGDSNCADSVTTCLISDSRYYDSQLFPAILAEIIWYLGAGTIYAGYAMTPASGSGEQPA